jgi:hypothetical protein
MIEDKTPQRTSIAQLGRIWIDRPDKTRNQPTFNPKRNWDDAAKI